MPKLRLGYCDPGTKSLQDKPKTISFVDFNRAFGDRAVRFLPSTPAETQQVLLEVGGDETKPPIFTRPGYYLVEGLTPQDAQATLHKLGIHV